MQVDLPLDDIIKGQRKQGFGRGKSFRGGRGGGRFGGQRSGGFRSGGRSSLNTSGSRGASNRQFKRRSSGVEERWTRGGEVEGNKKILVSNLSFMVTDDDVRELFSECGQLKRASINYDKSGRSHGSAEVVFLRREDAANAMRRYNNVQLDGRPMKIQFITTKPAVEGRSRSAQNSAPQQKRFQRRSFGGSGRGKPGVQKGKRFPKKGTLTKESLDADLEAYKRAAEGTTA